MNEIIFRRTDKIEMVIQNAYIEFEESCLVLKMTDEQTMQLGKLAMDIANSTEIKELSLKLEN